MTDAPATPSPERQPAVPKYAIGDHVQYIDHHNRMQSGEVYRIEASWASYMKNGPLIVYTVSHPTYRNNRFHAGEAKIISTPAPQAQPDARAVEGWEERLRQMVVDCEADPDDALMLSSSVAAEHAADLRTALQALSAPAADDGWRPISDYDGCGPVLVSTAPESPKYLFSEPVSAFHDAGGTWRCLGSKGGMAETALRPTHFRPLPAPPVALHPAVPTEYCPFCEYEEGDPRAHACGAAPTDEVGKS